jgi:hypothetical protein
MSLFSLCLLLGVISGSQALNLENSGTQFWRKDHTMSWIVNNGSVIIMAANIFTVFRIRIGLGFEDLDPDSAIYLSTDPDLGFPIAREV